MSRLEIIHLRTSSEPFALLYQQIKESIGAEPDSTEVVTLYRREGLETDVAIHIRSRAKTDGKGPSVLGLHLASELRAFGLVGHTVWEGLK